MKRILTALLALAMLLVFTATAEGMEILAASDIDMENVTIDPANPLGTLVAGFYEVELTPEEGETRLLYHYFPENLSYRQPEVVVAMPSGADAATFLEETGWKQLADSDDFTVILMVPGEEGWQEDETAYTDAVFSYITSGPYYMAQAAAVYMVGYGDSSSAVMDFATTHTNKVSNWFFSGFACFDVTDYDVSKLELPKTTATWNPDIMMSEVQMPMWLGATERTESVDALVEYWKAADECSDECYSDQYADEIYMYPAYMALGNELLEQHTSRVLLTLGEFDYYDNDFTAHLYRDFLKRTRRYDSNLVNAARYFASNDEKGMDHVVMDVNGVSREFYVYVPTAVKTGKLETVPVMFCYHGLTCSGEDMPTRSGWDKLAEDQSFIAVFPTGSRRDEAFRAATTWTTDDLPFFKATYDYLLENYPVDTTRVYVGGQSMGSVFSFMIAAAYPELVAAVGSTSYLYVYDENTVFNNEELLVPVAVAMGEQDHRFDDVLESWYLNWTAYWCERDGIGEINYYEDEGLNYTNGLFKNRIYTNEAGVPLVRSIIVTDKVHAVTPDEIRLIYDFVSQYSRGEDGTLYYMGAAVEK